MTALRSLTSYIARSPNVAGLVYMALIIAACLTTLAMLTDILEQYRARNASLDMLSRLQGHGQFTTENGGSDHARPPGSPFLKGQTATVASAALLQRITSIITNAGGTVVSSEMVQQGAQSKDGYVTAIANCELEQDALQKVLYDIEAGLPFLFVDQLMVQSSAPGENGKLRVTLGVAALWSGAR
jgi:general secretion pathway protein M